MDPFELLYICSYLLWEPAKLIFAIASNNPICSTGTSLGPHLSLQEDRWWGCVGCVYSPCSQERP